jgi:hypothetical protein
VIRTRDPRHVKANNDDDNNNNTLGGARGFNSPSSIDWQQFHNFLLQRMTANTAEDRLRYAKQYASVFWLGPNQLLQLPPHKRIHIMKSLSCLARFTGHSEQWRQIRQQYQLSWSTGTEKIDVFTRFFDSEKSLDVLLQWLKEAIQVLPSKYANLLLFCTLTGMRGTECIEAIRLLHTGPGCNYYNPDSQILQHYLYPKIFIRRTKAIYISIVNDEIIGIAQKIGNTTTQRGLQVASTRRHLRMKIKYCRKIQASYLRQSGIEPEVINMLQGRVGKDIFLRHYLTPAADFKDRVLDAVSELQKEIK